MQEQTIIIDADSAIESLQSAISRLELAILAKNKKFAAEEKIRNEVVKELDTYIASLETLLNSKKK